MIGTVQLRMFKRLKNVKNDFVLVRKYIALQAQFRTTYWLNNRFIISAKWTEWMAEILFSFDVCVCVCVCPRAADRSIRPV